MDCSPGSGSEVAGAGTGGRLCGERPAAALISAIGRSARTALSAGRRTHRATRLLLVAQAGVTLFESGRDGLAAGRRFNADASGRADFATALAERRSEPLVVLVDRGDEVYRRERIPPLRGASRRALLTRRARQMGSEPFYQLTLGCGREAGGRGDEWVLFCAVPAGEWLTDWLDLALGQRVPVRCLSSLPALMPALWRLAADRMPGEHVLMVSWHPASGLRQSVLTRGRLQFCRCVPLSWSALEADPAVGSAQIERLLQYLRGHGFLPDGALLKVYLLGVLATLKQDPAAMALSAARLETVSDAALARCIGLEDGDAAAIDAVLAWVGLGHRPDAAYALPRYSIYADLAAAQRGLRAVSAGMTVLACAWAMGTLTDAQTARAEAAQLTRTAAGVTQALSAEAERIAEAPVEPVRMQAMVAAVSAWHAARVMPDRALQAVSEALDRRPTVKLLRLNWRCEDVIRSISDGANGTANPPTPRPGCAVVVELHADCAAACPDQRSAMREAAALAAALRGHPDVSAVDLVRAPIETGAAQPIRGDAAMAPLDPQAFLLRLVFVHRHG
jgi:hypothetical protein